jgi:hypothetical protein
MLRGCGIFSWLSGYKFEIVSPSTHPFARLLRYMYQNSREAEEIERTPKLLARGFVFTVVISAWFLIVQRGTCRFVRCLIAAARSGMHLNR